MKGIRGRLTYANVVATLAFFLAVGGGAYAVTKIGPEDVRRNAIKSRHLALNAAKGRDVKESSLATVPDAARLGGLPLGQIIERIDFSAFGASNAEPAETVQRVGGIDLTIRCTQVSSSPSSNAVLEIIGDPVVEGGILFDTTISRGGTPDGVDHRGGGFDEGTPSTLLREETIGSRGNVLITWREPTRTVSIQGRYDVGREFSADCGLHAVATVAPA